MNTKKLIGLACWLLAFLIPFQFALLDTEHTVNSDGTANNVKGLISFVAMLILLFAGYMFYDGADGKKTAAHDGHGH
ncbi:MAG TPA: hypothetical protein VHL57_00695 [Flavobacteriales bacterium]|jgi:hypothetical protein|nr:hypothetical protein [Flavobacteriales bacterium]